MLRNGLFFVADSAVRASSDPGVRRYRSALILGSLREDVVWLPLIERLTEYPSFSHFYRPGLPGGYLPFLWPGPRFVTTRLYDRALRAHRAGRRAAAFATLGRALHVLTDMSIPSHANRVAHERDPFEWYVEGNLETLRALPVPEAPSARRPADLVESLARAAQRYRPDRTSTPIGRLLRRAGVSERVSAKEAGEQARVLLPLAVAHATALLGMFVRATGASETPRG